ncbi:MAG TPA: hypothetical protein VJ961_03215, partial [Mariprofundaceae bacterium]|nr:hypothetical protein [Mariprofundaceae bacterium]
MTDEFLYVLEHQREYLYGLLRRFHFEERPILLSSDIRDVFRTYQAERGEASAQLIWLMQTVQEALVAGSWYYFALRPEVASWEYIRINSDIMEAETISVSDYLYFKERLVTSGSESNDWTLEIDFAPFHREFPKLRETRSIGQGVSFLNRRLSSQLFGQLSEDNHVLLDFLRLHQIEGTQLMLGSGIRTLPELRKALRLADTLLRRSAPDASWDDVERDLTNLGFAPGWGRDVERIRNTMSLLSELLE